MTQTELVTEPDRLTLTPIDEARLGVYTGVARRCRWSILTMVLLSCLLLVHIYLERVGFQDNQARQLLVHRVEDAGKQDLDGLEKRILAGAASAEERADYGAKMFRRMRGDKLIEDIEIPSRKIPLLGLSIPGNDFLPVVTMMLAVFVVTTWLAIRTLRASLTMIHDSQSRQLMDIARLQFVFTGASAGSVQDRTAALMERMAILFPCATVACAVLLDFWPVFKHFGDPGVVFGPVGLRFAIMMGLLLAISLATAASWSNASISNRLADSMTLAPGADRAPG